jgi:uncharacterized protein YlxW (UPF0749 family)
MAKHRRGVRIVIGKDKQTLTEQEMRQREILRLTRELLKLEKERRKLKKRLKDIGKEMRVVRRAQKIVLAPVHLEEFDSAARPAQP